MGKRNATYEQNEAETLKDTIAVKISMSSLWAHIQGSIDSDDSPKNKTRGTWRVIDVIDNAGGYLLIG